MTETTKQQTSTETVPATYHYRAPSGVWVTSCKPEPTQQSLLRYAAWSYSSWTRKIIRTQINRFRRVG